MRERQCKKRLSLNGWTLTWAVWPAESVTSTLTSAMDACLFDCWRFSPVNNWSASIHPSIPPSKPVFLVMFICQFQTLHCCEYPYTFISLIEFLVLSLSAKANQGPYAHPLSGERWQGSAVPKGTKGSSGEYGFSRHSRRKPPPHTWTHLDYNPPLPGRMMWLRLDLGVCLSLWVSWYSISHPSLIEWEHLFLTKLCQLFWCTNYGCVGNLTILNIVLTLEFDSDTQPKKKFVCDCHYCDLLSSFNPVLFFLFVFQMALSVSSINIEE